MRYERLAIVIYHTAIFQYRANECSINNFLYGSWKYTTCSYQHIHSWCCFLDTVTYDIKQGYRYAAQLGGETN